ncbi:MAG: hypothetical protein J7M29_01170 [Verrucomicrobia bacterium]|nr:hypothetical protein [Verrucomicrobiota bacterium]
MSVTDSIVREFFELRGFAVRQVRKHVGPGAAEEGPDFLVWNPEPQEASPGKPLPFDLTAERVGEIAAAVVGVDSHHTDAVGPARVARSKRLRALAAATTGWRPPRALGLKPLRLLVVPALPREPAARAAALEGLRRLGLDGALPFGRILEDLIRRALPNRHYAKSETLQLLRLLKLHGFLTDSQLTFFGGKPRRSASPRRD